MLSARAPSHSTQRLFPVQSSRSPSSLSRRVCICRGSQGAQAGTAPAAAELKESIRAAVSGTRRGKAASFNQRASINQLIQQLEKSNPSPVDPALRAEGWWALLYQASLKEEPGQEPDKATALEGPFLATFQPLTKDLVRTRANVQLLDVKGGRAENIAEFVAFGINGSLNIMGSAELQQPDLDGQMYKGRARIFVEFKEFLLSWGVLNLRVPLTWVKPTGWVETTYIEEGIGAGAWGGVIRARSL